MDRPNQPIYVIKASGERVKFSEQKLRTSLMRSGAGDSMADEVIKEIMLDITGEISTKKIYRKAFTLLKQRAIPIAGKYKLKQAIMELGPTGYPFEKFVGEILKFQGYHVKVGVIVEGRCVSHEVDVVATKENQQFMIECKFHNRQGKKTDVKVPLYIQSRFLDVAKNWRKEPGGTRKFHQGWVVTNTRFSADAIDYGSCAGLHMLGWDSPKKGSLSDRIALSGLYPVTCLTSLTKGEKQHLIDAEVVLCQEIMSKPELLNLAFVTKRKKRKVIEEVTAMCRVNGS